jgi:hypothetical protein
MTELTQVVDGTEIWEVADPLRAFKCQRCRLVHSLSFSAGSKTFSARTLNNTLGIGPPLERLTGVDRMNDVLAVSLFTMQNCLKLLFAGRFPEFRYLLPFSLWFAALHGPDVPLSCRQQMIEFCFRCFCEWLQGAPRGTQWSVAAGSDAIPFKYVAELPDLRRYLNSLLFLYKLLTALEGPLALNRVGTHPVENMFGLVRMKCKWKHTYTAFLRAFSHGMVMATILKATGLRSPVRRDYSIAGSKISLRQGDDRTYIDPTRVLEWLRVISGPQTLLARSTGDERTWEEILRELSPTSSSFIHVIELLIQSVRRIRPVFSLPGPIANQMILSRLFAFSSKSANDAPLLCSPSRKRRVRALLGATQQPDELSRIAEIVGCEVSEVVEVMHQGTSSETQPSALPIQISN